MPDTHLRISATLRGKRPRLTPQPVRQACVVGWCDAGNAYGKKISTRLLVKND
jgi:hypothetical protein